MRVGQHERVIGAERGYDRRRRELAQHEICAARAVALDLERPADEINAAHARHVVESEAAAAGEIDRQLVAGDVVTRDGGAGEIQRVAEREASDRFAGGGEG